jgi:hypothetical protein
MIKLILIILLFSTAANAQDSLFTKEEFGDKIKFSIEYPKGWRVLDSREVNKNPKNFEALVIFDTTALPGTNMIFVKLDEDKQDFDTAFKVYSSEGGVVRLVSSPKTIAGVTRVDYYIISGTLGLLIQATAKISEFEKYKEHYSRIAESVTFR